MLQIVAHIIESVLPKYFLYIFWQLKSSASAISSIVRFVTIHCFPIMLNCILLMLYWRVKIHCRLPILEYLMVTRELVRPSWLQICCTILSRCDTGYFRADIEIWANCFSRLLTHCEETWMIFEGHNNRKTRLGVSDKSKVRVGNRATASLRISKYIGGN